VKAGEEGRWAKSNFKCIFSSVGTERLGPSDLRAIRTAIYSVRSKWYDIGVELDIAFHTLDAIKEQCLDNTAHCLDNTADCLTEMLKKWLSSTSSPPTWTSLIEALSSEPVGEKRLAEEIREKYSHQDDEQASSPAPGNGRTEEGEGSVGENKPQKTMHLLSSRSNATPIKEVWLP